MTDTYAKYKEYPNDVISGKIVACKYVRQACERYLRFFDKYDFRADKVDKVVNFIGLLKHFTGKFNGKPFVLLPYQFWIVCSIFGFYHKGTDKRVTNYVYIELARKSGKALSIDTPIPTPSGYTTMGDLQVGDYVFDETGQPTQVTYVTPTMYDHKCYDVTFSDGETITCDADHNWYVDRYHKDRYHVETTQEIVDKGYSEVTIPTVDNDVKYIKDIKEVESVPVKCITVDSPNHLYLCGKRNTVTHNTALAAAIALYMMVADSENGAEVEMVANSAKQAKICFSLASNFLQSIDQKGKYFKRYRDSIKFDRTKSFIQILSSDASGNDGYNSSCFILDECHEQPDSRLWDVMCSSQGMRENPLGIIITTAGFNLFSFCFDYRRTCTEILAQTKEDDSQFAAIYTLDDDDDWQNPDCWIKSNPSMDVTVKREFLQQQVDKAKNNSGLEVGIRTKNLNQWLSSSTIWLDNDLLLDNTQKLKIEDFNGETCYMGVDLASVSDMTALGTMIPKDDKLYFITKYYLPQSTLSGNPNAELYKKWWREGYLTVTDGNVCDYDYILRDILKINNYLYIDKIAYDQYNATQWAISCTNEGLPLVPYSQALWNFNRPTKEFERLMKMGKIVLDNNPITRWCFQNVTLKYDSNENVKPVKTQDMQKIDGVIADIQALGVYLDTPQYNNIVTAV